MVLRKYGIFIAFIAVVIILSIMCPSFLTWKNLLNIVRQSSIYGVMAVGMTFLSALFWH
jgi:ribose/xylose/arabinose/galactoside ABC-type transport system permease subunit